MAAPRIRLGELLVDAQIITRQQLEEVLALQKTDARRLGTLLVEAGLVTETQVTQILSQQLSVPWVSLYHIDFSRQLLNLVPREIAEKYCLVPIFVRRVRGLGETLYVAMDDPSDENAVREVGQWSGLPVRAMIAPPSDIRSAIGVYYGGEFEGETAPGVRVDTPVEVPVPPPRGGERRETSPTEPAAARPVEAVAAQPQPVAKEPGIAPAKPPDVPPAKPASIPPPKLASVPPAQTADVAPTKPASVPPPKAVPPAKPASVPPAKPASVPPPKPASVPPPKPASVPPAARPASVPPRPESVPPASGPQSRPASAPPTAPSRPPPMAPAMPETSVVAVRDSVLPASERGAPAEVPALRAAADERISRASDPGPAIESREIAMPAPRRGGKGARMITMTLLDGTQINLPAQRPGAKPQEEQASQNQLTARDLVAALRAVAHGADASDVLGPNPRWEAMFSALLSLLLKKHLIADWEFVEELKKL